MEGKKMVVVSQDSITELLVAWHKGSEVALTRMLPLVHKRLRRLAQNKLMRERVGHTLQPTALVNEFFLRLVARRPDFADREEFFQFAAVVMNRLLIDHAKARKAKKRDSGLKRVPFDLAEEIAILPPSEELADLKCALKQLAAVSLRQYRVVWLLFVAGLTMKKTANALGISEGTARRDYNSALAFIRHVLGAETCE